PAGGARAGLAGSSTSWAVATSAAGVSQATSNTGAIAGESLASRNWSGPAWQRRQQWSEAWCVSGSATRAANCAMPVMHNSSTINKCFPLAIEVAHDGNGPTIYKRDPQHLGYQNQAASGGMEGPK